MVETTVLSLSYGKIVIKPPEKLHGLVPASFETYQIVDPTDIIIRPTDLQNDWNSLRVGLTRDRGIITSAYMCLRTIAPTIPEYGYLLLHAYDLKKIFYGMGSGLRQNLSFSDFKRMPVLTPPPDEQRAIARCLDHVDRLTRRYIHAQQRLIALLTEQKQALIQQAVTRGLDPDVRLKPSGSEWLEEIPAHWETLRVKQCATKISKGTTPSTEGRMILTEGTIRYIKAENISAGTIVDKPAYFIDEETHSVLVRSQLRIRKSITSRFFALSPRDGGVSAGNYSFTDPKRRGCFICYSWCNNRKSCFCTWKAPTGEYKSGSSVYTAK